MTDKVLFSYEIVVTAAALITGLATVIGLLAGANWLPIAAGIFIAVWGFILLTAVPLVNWHDHVCEGEQAPHH